MAITYDAMGNVTGFDSDEEQKPAVATSKNKPEATYQEKLRQAADNLVTIGKAPRGTFALRDDPKQLDMIDLGAALKAYSREAQKAGTLERGASRDALFANLNVVAQAQVAAAKAAEGPQAGKKTDAAAPKPSQADVRRVDVALDAAAAKAAAPKAPSAEVLKQQEANAYLRVLGKTYDQFKAENALGNGADLAGKGATSLEALSALKARVKDSPEMAAFAAKMAGEFDKTQAGRKGSLIENDDVRALQYGLVASGKQLNKYGIDGKMGDETAAATRAQIALTRGGPSAPAAPAATATPAPDSSKPQERQVAPVQPPAPASVDGSAQRQGPAPVEDRSTYSAAALAERQAGGGGTTRYAQGGAQNAAPQVLREVVYVDRPASPQLGTRGGLSPYYSQEASYREPNYREGGSYARPMSPIEYRQMQMETQRERGYGRQDGMTTHREQQQAYGMLSRGAGGLLDGNKRNDGQATGQLLEGVLKAFDPLGQQNPRGPRF